MSISSCRKESVVGKKMMAATALTSCSSNLNRMCVILNVFFMLKKVCSVGPISHYSLIQKIVPITGKRCLQSCLLLCLNYLCISSKLGCCWSGWLWWSSCKSPSWFCMFTFLYLQVGGTALSASEKQHLTPTKTNVP